VQRRALVRLAASYSKRCWMTKPIARDPMYRQRAFDADVIQLCVRYITYRLSYRDLVEMMAERGVKVAHSTILRWVTRYVPEYEKRWARFSKPVGTSWRVDETYIPIKGKWHRRQARQDNRFSASPRPRHRSGSGVLPQSSCDPSAPRAAQGHARWTRT